MASRLDARLARLEKNAPPAAPADDADEKDLRAFHQTWERFEAKFRALHPEGTPEWKCFVNIKYSGLRGERLWDELRRLVAGDTGFKSDWDKLCDGDVCPWPRRAEAGPDGTLVAHMAALRGGGLQ